MFELTQIQNEIKAPKNQTNSFGKYNYRSCEDIQQALKPLLEKYKCMITISDEVVVMGTGPNISEGGTDFYNKESGAYETTNSLTGGERFYIKSTITFYDSNGISRIVSAVAREDFKKKGMADSQITGSASSYARKYALCGLLLLDDTKDADSFNN